LGTVGSGVSRVSSGAKEYLKRRYKKTRITSQRSMSIIGPEGIMFISHYGLFTILLNSFINLA
jgi:hypothetical protein